MRRSDAHDVVLMLIGVSRILERLTKQVLDTQKKPCYTRSRAVRPNDEFEQSALGDHVAATNHSIS